MKEEKNIIELKHKSINIPIYGDNLELYYGDGSAFKTFVENKYNETFENLDSYCTGYSAMLEKTSGKFVNIHMVLFVNNNYNVLEYNYVHTVHHESIHVAWNILDRVGVRIDGSNHESLTYLESYIAEVVCNQIEKWKKL
jgi:hypothetical protein